MANTFTSRDTLKTKLLAAVGSATTADQIVKLSRSIERANLDDDADLETALDTKVSAMATSASTADIEKLAFGVKKLRTPPGAATPTSSMIAEGSSNLYVTDSRVRSSFSASGDLSYNAGTGVLSYTALPDALTVYATVADLPASGVAAGAKGIVEENKKLYIFTGASWVGVGLVDQKPNFTTTPDGSYALSPGADTVITLAATDPQGDAITYSYQVTAGALGGTTVSQTDNVFTISASSNSADAGSFSLSFTASDGTNLTTTTPSEFTLVFGFNWDSIDIYTPYSKDENNSFGRWMDTSGQFFTTSKPGYFDIGMIDIQDSSSGTNPLGQQIDYIIPTWISSSVGQGPASNNGHGLSWLTGTYTPQNAGTRLCLDGNLVAFQSHSNNGDVQVWKVNTDGTQTYGQPVAKFMFTPRDSYLDQRIQDYCYFNGFSAFGQSIAMGGGYLAVGDYRAKMNRLDSPYDGDGNALENSGKVFVYDLSQSDEAAAFANGYVLERPFTPYNGTPGQPVGGSGTPRVTIRFGSSIAIAGDAGLLAVAAAGYSYSSNERVSGAVFIYNLADGSFVREIDVSSQSADGLGDQGDATSAPGAYHDQLRITPDGSRLVIGDQNTRRSGYTQRGAVSVYDVSTGAHIITWRSSDQSVGEVNTKWGSTVDITPDGNYVLFGAQDSFSGDVGRCFMVKVDGTTFDNNLLWWDIDGRTTSFSGFGTSVRFGDDQIYIGVEVQDAVVTYKA
tara:strand:- start:49 stop:2250 length:2202 start_codon:yes stop_codon:yes gene_type:complete